MQLSILIATYNRAEVLRQTLEAMCEVERECLDIEFVIIDNNSTDHTGEIIGSFQNRLPIRHLFQPVQGKSAALNLALDNAPLGDIMVFTDDDIIPRKDWLAAIVTACNTYPNIGIFGGCVEVIWPASPPTWLFAPEVRFALCAHDHGSDPVLYPETPYPSGSNYPTGANLWVRRELLSATCRFTEELGVGHPAGLMGEDKQLTYALARQGHKILFYPRAIVGHRVDPKLLHKRNILSRACRAGRAHIHTHLVPQQRLTSHITPLKLARVSLAAVASFLLCSVLLPVALLNDRVFCRSVVRYWVLGYHRERFQIVYSAYVSGFRGSN